MAKISFHTATTGVIEHQKALDSLANNIANVNTYGYKAGQVAFQDLLYTNVESTEKENVGVGHGARVSKMDTVFTKGVLKQTDRNLDFAIDDENGFFRIVMATGETVYTRNGNFELREYGDSFLLVSGSLNGYVTDANGNAILLKGSTDDDIDTLYNVVGTFGFANMDGLTLNSDGTFSESVSSGTAYADSKFNLKQGYLEASNVDYAEQITEVIKAQRAFQMNSRIITISDELEDTINNLR